MPKISIIIPVFNAEKYIEKCLLSVIKQTLKDIEIICIDDGSTDSSIEKIQKYMSKDKRIILLKQNNQGQGSARNKGIKQAIGQYVSFLDADDYYLDTDALEKMYLLCEKKGVKVCGSFRKNMEYYGLKDTHIIRNDIEIAQKKQIILYRENQVDFEFQNFIFDRMLLVNNNILFPLYRRFEDPVFLVHALNIAQKFVLADVYLYCYRVPNAVQRGGTDKTVDLLSGLIDNLKYAVENKLEELFDNTVKHINYENRFLISFDLQQNDIRIIEKLIEATHIIRNYYKNPDYVVNPLKDVINGYLANQMTYENHIKDILNENGDITIYGAGNLANIFLDYLDSINMKHKVRYVMVSSNVHENESFYGIPLISAKDKEMCVELRNKYVFIATTGAYHEEIISILKENGFSRFEALNDAFLFDYANTK